MLRKMILTVALLATAALAAAPSKPLPNEILARAKTGFCVPTGNWMNAVAEEASSAHANPREPKGVVSRQWSHTVFTGIVASSPDRAKKAA